ncbi:hypothetical protein BK121_23300 [Paenibacillus odorifer]|uniref:PdaC/SigV domain-containing protein n=1 Tax=Paenibacillus TaxID=44249 RepID=UPI000970155E|nr:MULTISPECIES: DUF4163 domain-containing protein [Paenibacillus]MDH6425843.1 hypothetical protein [Paenibacillus sp. PastH-4]MDH6441864.1 hypothetical protein [Paenibacillus sp. PastF-4]MDH6527421.1 hypothetical protein [Paenibacillus sp. PastH-3]OMC65152.1 hypothetical protein BK121_23300 [Paenibacillus odorifer]
METQVKKFTTKKRMSVLLLSAALAAVGTAAALPVSVGSVHAASTTATITSRVNVQVKGKAIGTQAFLSPLGNTLIPLKDAAQALGAAVKYDNKNHSVELTLGENTVNYSLDIDSALVKLNGSGLGQRYEAQVIGGTSFVAVQALVEPFGYLAQWNGQTRTVNITNAGMNELTITAGKLQSSNSHKDVTINIVYPVVSQLANQNAEAAINKAVKAQAQKFLDASEKQLAKSGAPAEGATYDFELAYKVTYNQNGVISFLLTNYQYLGGAHGGGSQTGLTYSLQDGTTMKLGDLLKSNSNYSQVIKKSLQEQVQKGTESSIYSIDLFNKLTKDSNAYLDNFYLTNAGFTVFFVPGDIAESVVGSPEFKFTWAQFLSNNADPFAAY